jgi:hypothetical protein
MATTASLPPWKESNIKSENVTRLRADILTRSQAGQTVTAIAQALNCSRTTVYKVLNAGDISDNRSHNPGRPPLYNEAVHDLILQLREQRSDAGPQMLHHLMKRDPIAFGLSLSDVPSSAAIARMINLAGLARKPIGPHDRRTYPDPKPEYPGLLTIDTWGPWQVRADKIYLATVQDRFSRLSAAVPALGMKYSHEQSDITHGLNTKTWARAILVAQKYLEDRPLHVVYSDNGMGRVPAFGTLPLAARTVLQIGARLTFIPPAQPWRNGRLENWHSRMEQEYWRISRPTSIHWQTSSPVP